MAKEKKLENGMQEDPWKTSPMEKPITVSIAAGKNYKGDVNVWIQATNIKDDVVTQWNVVRSNGNLILNKETGEFDHVINREHVEKNSFESWVHAFHCFKNFYRNG